MKFENLVKESYSGEKHETLKNGKVLLELEKLFCNKPSKEKMLQLMDCLTDSLLLLPVNTRITEKNAAIMKTAKANDIISLADDLTISPDYLEDANGNLYIPVFSQEEQVDQDYLKNFSVIWMHISEIIELYKLQTKLVGIILDPNKKNIIFTPELIEILENIMEVKEEALKNKKNEKQYIYVSIIYDDSIVAKTNGGPSFYYKTDIKEISVGDKVLVNQNNKEIVGLVVNVKIYHEIDVPYPLNKTKDIIKILNNYGDKIEVYQSSENKYIEMKFLGKYQYIGGEDSIDLTIGNIYNRVGNESEFRIVDNSGEDYLYSQKNFIKI